MTLLDPITPETLGLILTLAGFFGGAMFWIGILHSKLNSLQTKVNNLMQEIQRIRNEKNSEFGDSR
jgi:hypothetical protein